MEEAVMLRCEKGSRGCILSIAMPNLHACLWGRILGRSGATHVVQEDSHVWGIIHKIYFDEKRAIQASLQQGEVSILQIIMYGFRSRNENTPL